LTRIKRLSKKGNLDSYKEIWRKMKVTEIGFAAFLIILWSAACSEPTGTLNEVYKYPQELWGEWIRMDTGNTWYIASNYLLTNDSNSMDNITMEKQSENVIRVTKTSSGNTSLSYLYASRIPNGSFSGSVMDLDDNARSVLNSRAVGSGLGGIQITVSNLKDKANGTQTTTDNDGNFTADDVIPGDSYEIIGDGFSIPVYPNNSGEDIGTVTVTDGVNLVTSISPQTTYGSGYYDMMRLYPGIEYKLKIAVENVGTGDSGAAQYTLTLPAGLQILDNTTANKQTNTTGMLGTIEPGKTREILISVKCNGITDEYEYKNIGIETKDVRGKTWEDSVSLKFNRENITFSIVSEGAISGVVIVPNVRAYHFKTTSTYVNSKQYYTSKISVPKYKDDYLIVFSGATAASESLFSFAIDQEAEKDFTKNYTWGKYVDNTTETNAANVAPNAHVTYYLAKNDIIYFKVSFK